MDTRTLWCDAPAIFGGARQLEFLVHKSSYAEARAHLEITSPNGFIVRLGTRRGCGRSDGKAFYFTDPSHMGKNRTCWHWHVVVREVRETAPTQQELGRAAQKAQRLAITYGTGAVRLRAGKPPEVVAPVEWVDEYQFITEAQWKTETKPWPRR